MTGHNTVHSCCLVFHKLSFTVATQLSLLTEAAFVHNVPNLLRPQVKSCADPTWVLLCSCVGRRRASSDQCLKASSLLYSCSPVEHVAAGRCLRESYCTQAIAKGCCRTRMDHPGQEQPLQQQCRMYTAYGMCRHTGLEGQDKDGNHAATQ